MESEGYIEPVHKKHPHPHYYGDTVRQLFIGGGLVMLLALPLFTELFPLVALYPIFTAIVIGLAAGLVNPIQRWTHYINVFLALVATMLLEWYALTIYQSVHFQESHGTILFWLSHILALNFFIAFYFSVKTVRGMFVRSNF